ncbi:hypothetical protein GN956_G12757 [Arapaima gigas]
MSSTFVCLFLVALLRVSDAVNGSIGNTSEKVSLIEQQDISTTDVTDWLSSVRGTGEEEERIQTLSTTPAKQTELLTSTVSSTLQDRHDRTTTTTTTGTTTTTESSKERKSANGTAGFVVLGVIVCVILTVVLCFCVFNKKKRYSFHAQNEHQEDAGMPLSAQDAEAVESGSPKELKTFDTSDTQVAPKSPKLESGEVNAEEDKGTPKNSIGENSTSSQAHLTSADKPTEQLLNVKQADTDVSNQTSVESLKDHVDENSKSNTENAITAAEPSLSGQTDNFSEVHLDKPL